MSATACHVAMSSMTTGIPGTPIAARSSSSARDSVIPDATSAQPADGYAATTDGRKVSPTRLTTRNPRFPLRSSRKNPRIAEFVT